MRPAMFRKRLIGRLALLNGLLLPAPLPAVPSDHAGYLGSAARPLELQKAASGR